MAVEPFSTSRAVGSNWGVYGEDVMRPLSNLSITAGLRIEQEHVSSNGFTPFDPSEEAARYLDSVEGLDCGGGQCTVLAQQNFIGYEDVLGSMESIQAQLANGIQLRASDDLTSQQSWTHLRTPDNIDITNTNVAPRLSVAWDPWNDGKTKFTVSGGRYYDKIFLQIPVAEIEPVLVTNQWDATALYGGVPYLIYDPSFSFSVVDRNLKTPYQDEYSFAVEREIWEESSISFRYLHRNFKQQFQDININQIPGDYGRCQIQTAPTIPFIIDSPGTGTVTDPYTGHQYQDTDPGNGDGRLDDCVGRGVQGSVDGGPIGGGGSSSVTLQEADGFADLYVLNPAWQDIFKIGNYNSQKYDALIFEFVRRQYKNWQMEASYTWSQAFGQGEDFNLALGDDRSTLQDEQGYQSYDRRHAVKINATTVTPWGVRVGGSVQWQSGLPYSILEQNLSFVQTPPTYGELDRQYQPVRTIYTTHQRNDQRNRSYWNVDAKLVKEMNLPKGMNLQLTAEVFNLMNSDTYIVYNNVLNQGRIINGQADSGRLFGRQYQIGVRLAF